GTHLFTTPEVSDRTLTEWIRKPKWRPRATSIEATSGDASLMIDCVATVISFLQISSFSDAPPPSVKLLPLQFTNKRWNIPLSYNFLKPNVHCLFTFSTSMPSAASLLCSTDSRTTPSLVVLSVPSLGKS
ncbi:hypothetical protein F2P79_024347, partial [Pimephales promelas]